MRQLLFGCTTLFMALPLVSHVRAQTVSENETRIRQIEQQLSVLTKNLETVTQGVSSNGQTLKQLAQGVATNGDALRDLMPRVAANEQSIRDILSNVDSNNRQLRDIGKQDSQGGYYPNLLGNMQKSEFREEFRTAVKESRATRGRLWIYNPGPYNHIIYVNGARWTAIVGESYVWVPFGNVSVTHYSGITPPVRTVDDWEVSNGEYQIRYDFRRPW